MAVELQLTLDSMIRAVEQSAPGDALGQLANASATATVLGELGDSLLGVFVDRCRRDGHSWSEIGGSLGVTKQAVQKRFVTVSTPLPLSFERFTGRARTVLARANDEARALEHNHRGTEHLLLALFDDADALAAIILAELAVTRGVVVERVLDEVPREAAAPEAISRSRPVRCARSNWRCRPRSSSGTTTSAPSTSWSGSSAKVMVSRRGCSTTSVSTTIASCNASSSCSPGTSRPRRRSGAVLG